MDIYKSSQMQFGKESLLPQEEKIEIGRKHKRLVIGIPKEQDKYEGRVCLTPLGVELLVNNGHEIVFQSNAGKTANFSDNAYSNVGARIVHSKEEILQCDIVCKVSPLTLEEIDALKGNQIIFSAINMAVQKDVYFKKLMQKKVTCISFEFLQDNDGGYPIVTAMSEIAGSASILIAAEYLSNAHEGKGEMLGGISGIKPTEVIILGAGTAAEFAARTALGLGALVKVFDTSINKLRRMQRNIGMHLFTSNLQPHVLRSSLKSADVVIGAIRMFDSSSAFMVTEDMVREMKQGAVIVDISIDQGGCFETSEITNHGNPVFRKHGIIHYCVPNISSRVSRTASYALSNIITPILLNIGEAGGINQTIKEHIGTRHGIYIYNGILTNTYIGNKFNISSKNIDLLMAAF